MRAWTNRAGKMLGDLHCYDFRSSPVRQANLFHYMFRALASARNRRRGPSKLSDLIRFYPMWANDLEGESPLAMEIPWMTYKSIDFLRETVTADHRIFEFGSGGST